MIAALAASGRLDINSPVDMREALWVMMTQVPAVSSRGLRHASTSSSNASSAVPTAR